MIPTRPLPGGLDDAASPAPPPGRPLGRRGQRLLRLGLIVGALVCAGLGLSILATTVQSRLEARAVERWPTTTGLVVESGVVYVGTHHNREGRRVTYEPRVRYEYAVDGRRYVGDRFAIEPPGRKWREDADRLLDDVRVGMSVVVYYDPDDPADSVLERGVTTRSTVNSAVTGGAFLVFSLLMTWISFRVKSAVVVPGGRRGWARRSQPDDRPAAAAPR
jgi:hypothetical protein